MWLSGRTTFLAEATARAKHILRQRYIYLSFYFLLWKHLNIYKSRWNCIMNPMDPSLCFYTSSQFTSLPRLLDYLKANPKHQINIQYVFTKVQILFFDLTLYHYHIKIINNSLISSDIHQCSTSPYGLIYIFTN